MRALSLGITTRSSPVPHRWLALLAVTAFGLACGPSSDLPGTGRDAGRIVVYRDTWGVPHIYAPSAEAGPYAMGWAQAEDRPEQLLKNLLVALGESAAVDGPDVRSDLRAHMWDHHGTARREADRIPEKIRGHIRAFARGVNGTTHLTRSAARSVITLSLMPRSVFFQCGSSAATRESVPSPRERKPVDPVLRRFIGHEVRHVPLREHHFPRPDGPRIIQGRRNREAWR
jgi:hypothetical protein